MSFIPVGGSSIRQASDEALKALLSLSQCDEGPAGDAKSNEKAYTYSDEIDRLEIWIHEQDVRSGKLDHQLREASHLRDRVLELLAEVSDPGTTFRTSLIVPSENESPLRSRKTSLGSDKVPLNALQAALGERPEIESDSLSLDTNFTLPDSLPDSPLTNIHDAITFLFELSPSLLDPTPHDRAADSDAAQFDIDHIRERFPKASVELIDRLGRANWERRQYLRKIRSVYQENPNRAQKLQQFDPSRFYLPESGAVSEDSSDSDSKDLELSSEEGLDDGREMAGVGISTGPSLADSDLDDHDSIETESSADGSSTHPRTTKTAATSSVSAAGSTLMTSLPSETQLSQREVKPIDLIELWRGFMPANISTQPKPAHHKVPLPPEGLTGKPFLCPFCSHTVSGIALLSQWRKHVFADLEPYMCTYNECILSAKTYGSRQLWWEHEKHRHRVQRSWICVPCESQTGSVSTFDTSAAFEEHVTIHHPIKLTATQLQNIRDMCETESEVTGPSNVCPLCDENILSEQTSGVEAFEHVVMKHVSEHMEQLTLFVAHPAGKLLFEDDDSEFQDDSDSEDGLQSEIQSVVSKGTAPSKKEIQLANVQTFIEEQKRAADLPPGPAKDGLPVSTAQGSHLVKSNDDHSGLDPQSRPVTFPIMFMMHPPNEHFYSRQRLLADADKTLSSPGTICIFHGLGGVGKTLAGVEYIYTHKDQYDAIFWLQADTAPGLTHAYLQMVMALGIVNSTEDHDQAIDRGRTWLQETERRWLLVFDNAIQWTDIARFLPNSLRHTHGSVLITTQHENLLPSGTNVTKMQLDTLDTQAGSDMLLKYLNRDVRSDPERHLAKEISAFVGGLPVAIAQIAGYVGISELTLEELIDVFRQWRRRVGVATDEADDLPAAFREASTNYDETLDMVWEVTLRELSQDAREVLNILAFLNCERVPHDMLWTLHDDTSLHFLDPRESFRMKRIDNSLVKRRLVVRDATGAYSMHRSLQRGVREKLSQDKNKQQEVFDNAVAIVREVFPVSNPLQQPTPEKWSEFQKLLPHLYALHDVYQSCRPHLKGSLEFAQLLLDAGVDQFERGIIHEGLLLLGTAEMVFNTFPLEEHQVMRANIHSMIAIMYDNTGVQHRQEALERREAALEIRKKKFETDEAPKRQDEILLFNSWMEYAMSLLHYHRYEDAEPIIDKCLAKFHEWGSEQTIPFEYAKYYNKIALVRMYQRRFDEAIELATRGVQLMRRVGYNLFASRFKFDLACIVLQSGDLDQALRLHQEIYSQRMETVGMTNELTLHSVYAVGAIYELKEDFDEAAIWYRRVLDQRRRVTSWPVEAYGRTQLHLAKVLTARGRPEDIETADGLRERALRTLQKLLPLDKPYMPSELETVTDEAILFDHLLPITPGGPRFTGIDLLPYFTPKP